MVNFSQQPSHICAVSGGTPSSRGQFRRRTSTHAPLHNANKKRAKHHNSMFESLVSKGLINWWRAVKSSAKKIVHVHTIRCKWPCELEGHLLSLLAPASRIPGNTRSQKNSSHHLVASPASGLHGAHTFMAANMLTTCTENGSVSTWLVGAFGQRQMTSLWEKECRLPLEGW